MTQPASLLEKELRQAKGGIGTGWPWHLLLFMVVVLGLTVLVYLGMLVGYGPYLQSEIKKREDKLVVQGNSLANKSSVELARFYSELVNTQKILSDHSVASKILDLIENNLYPEVYLTGIDIQSVQKTIRLTGVARDYAAVGSELSLLRGQSGVKAALLEDSSVRELGDVRFTIRLVADPAIFRQ